MQIISSIESTAPSAMPKVLSGSIDLNSNLVNQKFTNAEENVEINNKNGKKKKKVSINGLKSELTIDEHRIPLTELCERFSTNLETVC